VSRRIIVLAWLSPPGHKGCMTAFLLVVFDGLRPDMVRPDTTPHLWHFAAEGLRFAHARSVFPSETRVCTAAIATGCYPNRHGLVANRMPHPTDPQRSVDTGDISVLRALEQELGAPLLEEPTLAERLARAGRSFAVLSSGTTGHTFVLNPRAEENDQLVLSAHGAIASSARGRALLATLDPLPAEASAIARSEWIAEVFRTRLLPEPPDATILWLAEPDTTAHYGGLGSPAQWEALRRADAAFGRIVADWQAGPQRERLQIAVASDHGHATISGRVSVAAALARQREFAGCLVLSGASGGIIVPDQAPDRIAAVARWLMHQDWCGSVFAPDLIDLPDGVLPRSALLSDHRRAAPVLFTLRADGRMSAAGLPGTILHDGGLERGAGIHGGLSRAELRTVLLMGGSRIRKGLSEFPAGIVDIAPTVLALLGLPGAETMDGRILGEAIDGMAAPEGARTSETWEAAGAGYAQRLSRLRLGEHVWLDEGGRAIP
jgi:arylsulfatase A-like enzyme